MKYKKTLTRAEAENIIQEDISKLCNFTLEIDCEPKPKAPSHEEIMTKYWQHWDGAWSKVFAYFPEDETYGLLIRQPKSEESDWKYRSFVDKDYFTGLESATIPPESA